MPNEQDPEWMSTDQVALLFQVPAKTVQQWRWQGTGPPGIKVGRHVRYRRSDVDAWARKQVVA